jgi:hypothetical protein
MKYTHYQSSFHSLHLGFHRRYLAAMTVNKEHYEPEVLKTYLALLHGQNTIFYRILNYQAIHRYISDLAQTMDAVECLIFNCLGPAEVERNDIVCTSEIQTNACSIRLSYSFSKVGRDSSPPHLKDIRSTYSKTQ